MELTRPLPKQSCALMIQGKEAPAQLKKDRFLPQRFLCLYKKGKQSNVSEIDGVTFMANSFGIEDAVTFITL